jgi:hypothetical protein
MKAKNKNALYSIIRSKPIKHVDSYRLRLRSHCLLPNMAVGRNLHAAGFRAKKLCLLLTFFLKVEGRGCSIYLCNEIYIWIHISLCLKARGLAPKHAVV